MEWQKKGSDYEKILKHYYTGVEIKEFTMDDFHSTTEED